MLTKSLVTFLDSLTCEGKDLDVSKLIKDVSESIELLQHPDYHEESIPPEECFIFWGDEEELCPLDNFLTDYTEEVIRLVLDIIRGYDAQYDFNDLYNFKADLT